MSTPQDVTIWIDQFRAGDREAAQKIWEGYFPRLVGLARTKLRGAKLRAADEEDVIISVFDSFFRGVEHNRFPRLTDRQDLWHVLVMITARKAIDLRQHENAKKRGGGVDPVGQGDDDALAQVIGREPTPEFAAQVAEECQRLLQRLGDDMLRDIAVKKMEGFTNEEVAAQVRCSVATVERRLKLIRREWQENPDDA